jgi:hypothetical protein
MSPTCNCCQHKSQQIKGATTSESRKLGNTGSWKMALTTTRVSDKMMQAIGTDNLWTVACCHGGSIARSKGCVESLNHTLPHSSKRYRDERSGQTTHNTTQHNTTQRNTTQQQQQQQQQQHSPRTALGPLVDDHSCAPLRTTSRPQLTNPGPAFVQTIHPSIHPSIQTSS